MPRAIPSGSLPGLCGAYGRGALHRGIGEHQRQEAGMLLDLIRAGWDATTRPSASCSQPCSSRKGPREQHQWFNELERISTSPENAATLLETTYRIDVSALASTIRVPTIIFHARNDARVPFDEGRDWPQSFQAPASFRWKAAITYCSRRSLRGLSSSPSCRLSWPAPEPAAGPGPEPARIKRG